MKFKVSYEPITGYIRLFDTDKPKSSETIYKNMSAAKLLTVTGAHIVNYYIEKTDLIMVMYTK